MDLHQIQEGLVHGSAAPSPKTTLMKHVSARSLFLARRSLRNRQQRTVRGHTRVLPGAVLIPQVKVPLAVCMYVQLYDVIQL